MEFFIFLCFMSFVSFAVAFLAYGLVIRLMGTTSSASRYSQIILVPIAIIGYDFLTITAPAEYRYVIGGLPMLLLGLMLLYYRFGKGGQCRNRRIRCNRKKHLGMAYLVYRTAGRDGV